jgi:hypothetical protein
MLGPIGYALVGMLSDCWSGVICHDSVRGRRGVYLDVKPPRAPVVPPTSVVDHPCANLTMTPSTPETHSNGNLQTEELQSG